MAQLTKKQIDMLRFMAKDGVPYDADDPELDYYDGDIDVDRLASLRAREILAAHGVPIEPQEGETFPDDEGG